MSFTDVDRQKIGMILVVVENLDDVANLATEGRSSKAPENENQRTLPGPFAQMKTTFAIERNKPDVRSVAANFQSSAMHVRQGVTHHAVSILGTPGEIGERGERGNQEHCDCSAKPLKESFQLISKNSVLNKV
jgi:hypothetical protein